MEKNKNELVPLTNEELLDGIENSHAPEEAYAFDHEMLPAEPTELDNDLNLAREKQLNIIDQGHKGLEELMKVTNQSQLPRAYEVLATYLKTLSEINKDLISIAERKSFSKEDEPKPAEPTGVTNQLFVGSTAELAAMLKGIKSEG